MQQTEVHTKGKKLLLIIFTLTLLSSISWISFYLFTVGNDKLPQQMIRIILEIALMYYTYKGKAWAKWTFIVLYSLAGLGSIILIFFMEDLNWILAYSLMGIVYTFFAILIRSSTSITEFLKYQYEREFSFLDEELDEKIIE